MTITYPPVSLKFDLTPELVVEGAKALIEEQTKAFDHIASLEDSDLTPEYVLACVQNITAKTCPLGLSLVFPQFVSENKDIRKAAAEAEQLLNAHEVELTMRKDIFDVFAKLQNRLDEDPEASEKLDAESKRFIDREIKEGHANGLHLSPEHRAEVERLSKKLSELCIQFSTNLGEENTILEFSRDELAGVPESLLSSLDVTEEGKLKVTMKYPHVRPILKKCTVKSTRQALSFAFSNRCAEANTAILTEVVQLRKEKATILGFNSHADVALQKAMAKNSATVKEFLEEMAESARPVAAKDLALLCEFRQAETGEDASVPFEGCDLSYYTAQIEEKLYSVDHTAIQEYFPMEHVRSALFELYQNLLGLKYEKVDDQPVWHSDVPCFRVTDAKDGHMLGYFYLDLFPREGKFGHAMMVPLQPYAKTGGEQFSVAALVCNFTSPTADKPSLLTHTELVTFFHEFGHCMHELCGNATKYVKFAGTCVEWDFVECPSQMLENWCWEKEVLQRLSSHYISGEALTDDLCDKLIASRVVNEGLSTQRNVGMCTYDQLVHGPSPPADVTSSYNKILEDISGIATQEGTHLPATWGHICGGYDAKYYGYLWAEVFAADVFVNVFRNPGKIMDSEAGQTYRKLILSRGGSIDATEMLREILGREPNQQAFLELKGIVSK